jgi:hypothetical protein
MREPAYPESYHELDTCFNCKESIQIDGCHVSECKKYNVCVALWCICDDYVRRVYLYETL